MQINLKQIQRLLIIQIRPFGDVLLNTGYLPYLRQKLPNAEIDFLVKHPFQSILNDNPHVDHVLVFGKTRPLYWLDKFRLILEIRHRRYDVIVDQIQGTTSAQIVLFSGATYKIARENTKWRRLYNVRVPSQRERYTASMKFDLLQPLGVGEAPYQLHYSIHADAVAHVNDWLRRVNMGHRRFVCISPGSPRIKKKWGADLYAKLGDLIMKQTDRQVVLLWGPDELADVETVAAAMTKDPLIAPPTTYNQAAAMLKACELLICNDGGLNHLSVATGTKSLAVFGRTSPACWSPQDVFPGHYHVFNPAWKGGANDFGIRPEEVFEKVRSILSDA
jgi:heptosyltransferase-3